MLTGHVHRSGCLCSTWGLVMFFLLPDSPVTAPLLSKRERRIAVERLRENQTGVENKHIKLHQIREAFLDYKLYFFFALGLVCEVPPPSTVSTVADQCHLCRQYTKWWNFQFWNPYHQRLWVLYSRYDPHAGIHTPLLLKERSCCSLFRSPTES